MLTELFFFFQEPLEGLNQEEYLILQENLNLVKKNFDSIFFFSKIWQEPLEALNQEGLLGKLRSVVRQNIALRDTVHQNNHALRQQLMMVVRWSRAHQVGIAHKFKKKINFFFF